MSFLGGAECSTAGNPLTQFTKHVQSDNTLQRDRMVGNVPGTLGESMRSRIGPTGSDQVAGILPARWQHADLVPDDKRIRTTSWPDATAIRDGPNATGPTSGTWNDTKNAVTQLDSRFQPWRTVENGGCICILEIVSGSDQWL